MRINRGASYSLAKILERQRRLFAPVSQVEFVKPRGGEVREVKPVGGCDQTFLARQVGGPGAPPVGSRFTALTPFRGQPSVVPLAPSGLGGSSTSVSASTTEPLDPAAAPTYLALERLSTTTFRVAGLSAAGLVTTIYHDPLTLPNGTFGLPTSNGLGTHPLFKVLKDSALVPDGSFTVQARTAGATISTTSYLYLVNIDTGAFTELWTGTNVPIDSAIYYDSATDLIWFATARVYAGSSVPRDEVKLYSVKPDGSSLTEVTSEESSAGETIEGVAWLADRAQALVPDEPEILNLFFDASSPVIDASRAPLSLSEIHGAGFIGSESFLSERRPSGTSDMRPSKIEATGSATSLGWPADSYYHVPIVGTSDPDAIPCCHVDDDELIFYPVRTINSTGEPINFMRIPPATSPSGVYLTELAAQTGFGVPTVLAPWPA